MMTINSSKRPRLDQGKPSVSFEIAKQNTVTNIVNRVSQREKEEENISVVTRKHPFLGHRKRNLTHHILAREGVWMRQHHSTKPNSKSLALYKLPKAVLEEQWSSPSWIKFNIGSTTPNDPYRHRLPHRIPALSLPNDSKRNDCFLSWDTMGVLLATYDGYQPTSNDLSTYRRQIKVYDWDVVRAADHIGRNHLQRLAGNVEGQATRNNSSSLDGHFELDPILCIPLKGKGRVTELMWNPFHLNELVVATTDVIYLFDVEDVAHWQQEQTVSQTQARYDNPPGRYFPVPQNNGGQCTLLFVNNGNHLVVGCGTILSCWLVDRDLLKPSLLWKFTWKMISTIVEISSDLILLGSRSGHFALLNWRLQTKAAFTMQPIPLLIHEWVSFSGIRNCPSNEVIGMGIRHAHVTEKHPGGLYRIIWVTDCGWLLSSRFDINTNHTPTTIVMALPQVLHRTSTVRCFRLTGSSNVPTHVHETNPSWSVPIYPVKSQSNTSLLCWENVPSVSKMLPHQDKTRLGSTEVQFHRSLEGPSLRCMCLMGNCMYCIPMPKIENLCALALHPDSDWIVAWTDHGLTAITTRRAQ
jgi:hypothetical protein